jgi:hypothetical protein
MNERTTRKMISRAFFGRGISNPKFKEMAAKAHFIIERGTCTLKDKKEGK